MKRLTSNKLFRITVILFIVSTLFFVMSNTMQTLSNQSKIKSNSAIISVHRTDEYAPLTKKTVARDQRISDLENRVDNLESK